MAVGRKGWLLMLAGVMLVVAATAAAGDAAEEGVTADEDSLHGTRHICEIKCQHHHDPANRKRCVDFCIRYQLTLDAAMKERATADEDGLRGTRHICEIKCQHHHDPENKKRCVDFCIRYQLALDAVTEEDGAAAAAAVAGIVAAGEPMVVRGYGYRRDCELKCQHHRDPANRKRCVDYCERYQLALDAAIKKDEDGAMASEVVFLGYRRDCELKCQHHHDPANRKRCVDYCERYQLMTMVSGGVKEDGAIATAEAIRQVV